MAGLRPAAAALAGLLLLAACGDDGSSPDDATPGAAAALRVTATRSSLFDSQRTFRLEVANEGDQPVALGRVRLDSPLFDAVPTPARDTEVPPGGSLLIPLPYGDARCEPAARPSAVVAQVGGSEVALPLGEDPPDLLADLHALECAQAQVRERVDVVFGDDWQAVGPVSAAGELRLRARGDGAATVEAIEGNIVFGVRAPDRVPLLAVDAGAPEDVVPVVLVVDRCDTHALIESKRTFKFPLEVRLDGGEPAAVVLEAEPGSPAR